MPEFDPLAIIDWSSRSASPCSKRLSRLSRAARRRAIDEHALACKRFQAVFCSGVSPCSAGSRPVGRGRLKCRQVCKVDGFAGLSGPALYGQEQRCQDRNRSPKGEQFPILR